MIELPGEVLCHDAFVEGCPAVKSEATLLKIGHELFRRRRHLPGIRAEAKIAQELAVHRHT